MKKARQIAAIIGIIILVGMYIVTLIAAITSSENTQGLFMASLFCSLVIPIMIFVFTRFYQLTHKDGAVSIRKAKKLAKQADEAAAHEADCEETADASEEKVTETVADKKL